MRVCKWCGTREDADNTYGYCHSRSHVMGNTFAHEWTEQPEPGLYSPHENLTTPLVCLYCGGVNPKDALGAKKPQMGLIPVGAMASVARVMELGAKKYGAYNWRSKAIRLMVYAHAALRHIFSWIGGETNDPESGEPHLAHAAACCLIALDARATGNAVDDREWPTDQNKDSK